MNFLKGGELTKNRVMTGFFILVEIQKETLAKNKTLINLENIKNQHIKKYSNTILELRKNGSGSQSIEKFLYELVMNRYKLMEEHKSIIMIFMNELSFHNEIQELFRKEIGEKVNDILTKSFDNFFKRGVFRYDINTRSAMRYFSGMIFVIFIEHVHGMRDENVSIEEDVKIAIDIFLNGVRNRN